MVQEMCLSEAPKSWLQFYTSYPTNLGNLFRDGGDNGLFITPVPKVS